MEIFKVIKHNRYNESFGGELFDPVWRSKLLSVLSVSEHSLDLVTEWRKQKNWQVS